MGWRAHARVAALLAAPLACGDSTTVTTEGGTSGSDGTTAGPSTTGPTVTSDPGTSETGTSAGPTSDPTTGSTSDPTTGTSGGKLDVGPPPPDEQCKVPEDELDAIPECQMSAPPDIFAPELQWDWWGEGGDDQSITTPLVANLTDDDDNGEIDLCDVPDVVVLAAESVVDGPAHLYVLDGETGLLHWSDDTELNPSCNPALGDVDGDGIAEIIVSRFSDGNLIAFNHDGSLAWEGTHGLPQGSALGSISIADLDQDGVPELIAHDFVADNEGNLLFQIGGGFSWSPTAADLDGEPGLEAVFGGSAYHADGTPYYTNAGSSGFTAVADIDDDPEPEVINTSFDGIRVLEHDGTTKWAGKPIPIGDVDAYLRPHTIHDFDDDGAPELAMSTQDLFSVFEFGPGGELAVTWSAQVLDASGSAGGTAFDFNKDGKAEAMYADESHLFIWDGQDPDQPLLQWTRLSRTLFEYPVVADTDNDGASEIVVVSNECIDDPCGEPSPTVQVLRDEMERWAPARRIWNQHAYHVTNVREDGTIPVEEVPSWTQLNTFRTNATLEGGGVCTPPQ